MLAAHLGMVSESLLRALGAAPAINMFGMLRLLSDVGGLRAVVERAGADPEPLAPVCLFAEALVFGRLGPQGVPGIQAPRLLQLLERYREVPRSSGLAGQHSTPSAGKGSPEVRWGVCWVREGKVEGGPVCACWTAPWPAAGALVRLPDAAPPPECPCTCSPRHCLDPAAHIPLQRFLSKKSVEDVMKALRSPTKRAK